MAKRKSGQKKKYLGKRSFGRGNTKNRRGSGNRGGRGKAGISKHKWTWAAKNNKEYFGNLGFSRPVKKKEVPVIHVYELNQKAARNELKETGGKFSFEFRGKVLGTGKLSFPISVKASKWSKKAEEKIKAAGGEISGKESSSGAA